MSSPNGEELPLGIALTGKSFPYAPRDRPLAERWRNREVARRRTLGYAEGTEGRKMTRNQAIAIIGEHIEALRDLGVASLALFGSVARGEAAEDSDIDLLVEFSKPVGLFEFLEVKEYLESILGREVDLVPRDSLKPRIRDEVLAEAVDAA